MSEIVNRETLDLLFSVSRELVSNLDLHTVLERVLSLSSQHLGAQRASVIVLDEHEEPYDGAIIVENRIMPHTGEQLHGPLQYGLAGWVYRSRQPALVVNSSQDSRWQRRPDDEVDNSGAKSALCVPILAHDRVVGIMTLVHLTPNFFLPGHLDLLGAIADQAGIAIHNARLHGNLQLALRRYTELFEDSIDPIFITGWNGKVMEANRQALVVVGSVQAGDICEHYMRDFIGIDIDWLLANEGELECGNKLHCESELRTLRGNIIPVEAYVHKVNIAGEDAFQWILRDLSERKELDLLRTTLTESIVHDLRAPLSNILSSLDFFDIYLPPDDRESFREVLSIATRSAGRMFRLINSLLDINRLESGQSIANRSLEDPSPMLTEAFHVVQGNAEGKKQRLTMQVEPDLPKIRVDRDMILRVMINLLDNAVKYTPNGGAIVLSARQSGSAVELVFQDSGLGIPEDEREAVFNKFYRLRSTSKKSGFGLGLAFCRLAVEAHGGRIWVESAVGGGSRFIVQLPMDSEIN